MWVQPQGLTHWFPSAAEAGFESHWAGFKGSHYQHVHVKLFAAAWSCLQKKPKLSATAQMMDSLVWDTDGSCRGFGSPLGRVSWAEDHMLTARTSSQCNIRHLRSAWSLCMSLRCCTSTTRSIKQPSVTLTAPTCMFFLLDCAKSRVM